MRPILHNLVTHSLLHDESLFYATDISGAGLVIIPVNHNYEYLASSLLLTKTAEAIGDFTYPHKSLTNNLYDYIVGRSSGNVTTLYKLTSTGLEIVNTKRTLTLGKYLATPKLLCDLHNLVIGLTDKPISIGKSVDAYHSNNQDLKSCQVSLLIFQQLLYLEKVKGFKHLTVSLVKYGETDYLVEVNSEGDEVVTFNINNHKLNLPDEKYCDNILSDALPLTNIKGV